MAVHMSMKQQEDNDSKPSACGKMGANAKKSMLTKIKKRRRDDVKLCLQGAFAPVVICVQLPQ